jgi:hypothetical protein
MKTNIMFSQSLTLNWSQQISTTGWDWVNKIIPANNQSYIIIGGLPKTISDSNAVIQLGASDAFVAMFDTTGVLQWQKFYGSKLFDNAQDAIVLNNSIYVTGLYQDTIKEGNLLIEPPTYQGAFLTKLSTAGEINNLWEINNTSWVSNFLITSNKSQKLTCAYKCSELYTSDSTINFKADSNRIIIMDIDTNGIQVPVMSIYGKSNLVLSTLDFFYDKLYITGAFSDTLVVADTICTAIGQDDAFILCLNEDYDIEWLKTYGGNGSDMIKAIGTDRQKNLILSGYYEGTALFDSYILSSEGSTDVFVLKVDSTGVIQWIRTIAGSANEESYGVAIDSDNEAYVLGSFRNNIKFAPFPISPGYQEYISESGFGNMFLSKYSNSGNLLFSFALPGSSEDFGKSILVDSSDNLIIAGNFNIDLLIQNTNSDAPAVKLITKGANDIFIAKFADPCYKMKLVLVKDTCICPGTSLLLDAGKGFESYTWSTGELTQSIVIEESGTYSIIVTNKNGCFLKDSIEVKKMSIPLVFAGNDTIIHTDYFIPNNPTVGNCDSFFWVCNGTGKLLYADSINPVYFPTTEEVKDGIVDFTLTGYNECKTVQSIVRVRFNSEGSSFVVYPNPADRYVNVEVLHSKDNLLAIEMCSGNGSVLKKWENINTRKFKLDVSDLPVGIYHLVIHSTEQIEKTPLIIIEGTRL